MEWPKDFFRRKWLRHYLPLWSVLILLAFPWMASRIDEAPDAPALRTVSGSRELNVSADLTFALLAFWIWAHITTAYAGYSLRSAGERKYSIKGGKELRRDETVRILVFTLITAIVYAGSVIPRCHFAASFASGVTVIFPFLVLRLPP